MKYSIKDRVEKSIKVSKAKVFIRADFERFGGYDQVGRALRELIVAKELVKVGYGVYVKAKISSISGNPIPTVTMVDVGLQLMKKMGVKADIGKFARDYRDGKSTQIPMTEVIAVNNPKIKRKIGWNGRELRYEKFE
jgi:hypothetical protein